VRLIRASLLEGRVAADIRERVLDPVVFERLEVAAQSQISPETKGMKKVYSFVAPISLIAFMTMITFMSAGYLVQSLILENQNRVMEVLLSSVRPIDLLLGKMLGLGAAGIIPAGIYGTFPALMLVPYFVTHGWRLLVLSLIYVGLGYLLYAILMTTT